MDSMGMIFTPVLVRYLLGPLGLPGPITGISWTHRTLQKVLLETVTRLWLPTHY